jgi:transcriptional regulator with XRE-family HTH domain
MYVPPAPGEFEPDPSSSFGETVRSLRQKRDMGLRELARNVGISAAYLSQIEREIYPPPAEEKIRVIADRLGSCPETLMGLAGRIPSDIPEAIGRDPHTMTRIIRSLAALPTDQIRDRILPFVEAAVADLEKSVTAAMGNESNRDELE